MVFESWKAFFDAQRGEDYFRAISDKVTEARAKGPVFPPAEQVFRAFELTPIADVKVVILGQDPYHHAGEAHGLAFSVPTGTKPPPSLANVFRELVADVGPQALRAREVRHLAAKRANPRAVLDGDLSSWASRGVLLLNCALTVPEGDPGRFLPAWRPFALRAIAAVAASSRYRVHFVLWGTFARRLAEDALGRLKTWAPPRCPDGLFRVSLGPGRWATASYSPHPSPLSAKSGFFGSQPFSRANLAMIESNDADAVVDWCLS